MGVDPVTATIGASILGSGASIIGGRSAANAQKDAAANSNATQMQMFNTTQSNLQPYMQGGKLANNSLLQLLGLQQPGGLGVSLPAGNYIKGGIMYGPNGAPVGSASDLIAAGAPDAAKFKTLAEYNKATNDWSNQQKTKQTAAGPLNPLESPLLKPITMDQATLEKTPGYQFNLNQGLKATQNSAAARGLGVSGAALKGAAQYATGLADSTYQNQFNNAVTNQTNQFNRLSEVSQSGQNAAANLGGIGQQTAANIGNNQIGAGNAAAGSYMNTANGISNAAQSIPNAMYANKILDLYGNSLAK